MTDRPATPTRRTGVAGAVERLVTLWALLGGVIVLAIVAVNVAEVASGITRAATGRLIGGPELTSLLAAAAAFCFLPYAQIIGANVSADIFTARATPRTVAALQALAALVALGFCIFLGWRMSEGLADQRARGLATAILQVPVWPVYVVAVISLALTALAALVNLIEETAATMHRGGRR